MDDLLKNRARAMENAKKKRKRRNVSYSTTGKVIKGAVPLWKKILVSIGAALLLLLISIYIPPFFYHEKEQSSSMPVTPDAGAIKVYQTYLKNHPDDDFDGDGLSNSMELEKGTDVWKVDSDGDGVSDYAELFITETTPTDPGDTLIKEIMKADKDKGSSISTPYKVDDIIFWPDDYTSKAHGAVVRTLKGYRFCNYSGWVRFPEKVQAYGFKNGMHYELEHREEEDAWKIENSDEVVLYSDKIPFIGRLKFPFMDEIYLDDSDFVRVLAGLLPDKGGLVTCSMSAASDVDPDVRRDVKATLKSPFMNKSDDSRFGKNMNTLTNLSWVWNSINANQCIAVSMYSGNVGEVIGVIYGYTKDGALLVANEALEPIGELNVTERAAKIMDKEGNIGQVSWYEWKGLGFDSLRYGDRINFFSSTITGIEDEALPEPVMDEQDVAQDPIPEDPAFEQQPQAGEVDMAADQEVDPSTGTQTETPVQPEAQTELTEGTETEPASEIPQETEPAAEPSTELAPTPETEPLVEQPAENPDSVITFGF